MNGRSDASRTARYHCYLYASPHIPGIQNGILDIGSIAPEVFLRIHDRERKYPKENVKKIKGLARVPHATYPPALIGGTLPPNCRVACHLIYDDAKTIQHLDTASGSKETAWLVIRQRTGHLPGVRA
jgi:hypothetical protein